jgi:hypothetical protein
MKLRNLALTALAALLLAGAANTLHETATPAAASFNGPPCPANLCPGPGH